MQAKTIFLGLVLIFFTFSVRALEISGTCNSTSVQCDLQINEITVLNNSSNTQTFFPQTSGEVSDWLSILPESVTLGPGESGVFEVYTIATCYAEPGNYSAQLIVSGQDTQSISCEIAIEQGHFVEIDLDQSNITTTECKQVEYNISLDNQTTVPNQQQEFVNLSVAGLPVGWATLEKTQLIVEKGKIENVGLTVLAPCDAALGEYSFEVKATLFNPNFSSTDSAQLIIEGGQDLKIQPKDDTFLNFQTPLSACREEDLAHTIEITNNGAQQDTMELEIIDAMPWVKLSETTISIERGETKEIDIRLEKNDSEVKLYDFKLKASSTVFNFEKTVDFTVDLKDCYNIVVQKLFGEQNACNEDELIYNFSLFNDKETTLDLQATVTGLDGTVSPNELTISPQETKEIEVKFDVTGIGNAGQINAKDIAIEIIMDASGSMDLPIDGKKKLDIAKEAIISFISNISAINLGVRVFGEQNECEESTLLVPISKLNVQNISSKIEGFLATGETPLAQSLQQASNDFEDEKENYILIVSDGKESCSGDIDSVVQTVLEKGIKVYAIGFDIDQTGKEQLQSIAQKTSGQYFDAKNLQELLEIFSKITSELEIELPKDSSQTFSLKIDSQNFSFEKDFTLNVSDCHNIVLSVPDVSLCRQVEAQNSFSATNLGSKEQALSVIVEPTWVQSDQSFILSSGEEKTIPLTLNPPSNSTNEEILVSAKSENINVFDKGSITFLSEQVCYGFGLEVESEFEGRIGEGERRKIIFSNNGQTPMNISIEADMPWVYFEPEQIKIESGKTGFINFYITPPFNFLKQTKTVLFTARNEFGFEQQKALTLMVTGPGFGLIPANVTVTMPQTLTQTENGTIKVLVEFQLKNEGEQLIEIYAIESKFFDAQFDVQSPTLQEGESTKVTMTASIPTDMTLKKTTVEFDIKTSEGIFGRAIEFEALKEEQVVEDKKEVQSEEQTETGGLFTLANAQIAIILVLVIVVIALLLYSVLTAKEETAKEPKEKILQPKTVKKPKKSKKKIKKTFV